MNFNFLGYDILSATENMQKDIDEFNSSLMVEKVTLRFYSWKEPCVTFGYNQKEELVRKIIKEKMLLDIDCFAKRPTGGGLVVHHKGDLSWSLIFPVKFLARMSLLTFYCKISNIYSEVLKDCGVDCFFNKISLESDTKKRINDICLEYPAKYELVDSLGNKVIGSAQKKTKNKFIQQNSLFIKEPETFRQKLLDRIQNYFSLPLFDN